MQLKIVPGYEGGLSVGQRQKWTFYGTGPASYSQATGDVLLVPSGIYLDSVEFCMDSSGIYILAPAPSVVGTTRPTWTFDWYTAAGMTEVANGVNLSALSVQFSAWGGEF